MRGLLLTPYFASGAALGTTKETSDRYRPLLRTHCEKFARGRCISADLRNTQELKGIRAEKPLRERGVIILFAEAGWGLFDRIPAVSNDRIKLPQDLSRILRTRGGLSR